STITGWPRCERMPSAMMRPIVSVEPPAASGTRSVTGRDGKDCAFAAPIAKPAAIAMAIIVFIICVLPNVGYTVAPRIRPGLGGRNRPGPLTQRQSAGNWLDDTRHRVALAGSATHRHTRGDALDLEADLRGRPQRL